MKKEGYVGMSPEMKRKPHGELFWPRLILRKWLNTAAKNSDYSADTDSDSASDDDNDFAQPSPFYVGLPRRRRRNSETFRQQYINTKEIRICVCTWNVGGKLPPEDLDIDDWIDTDDPADIYVFGLQEIVPLNAGNIFGAEDNRPVPKWENIIREAINRIRPSRAKVKCYSDPPSPSKFEPSDDVPTIEEEILLESDSDIGEEVHPFDEESNTLAELDDKTVIEDQELQRQFSFPRRLSRLSCLQTENSAGDTGEPAVQNNVKLSKMLSGSERIGLCWPEPPLNLLSQHVLQRPTSFKSIKSFEATKSFRKCESFKLVTNDLPPALAMLADLDLEALMKRKRRSSYARIVSKQMVGVFLTIWVRKSLRKHIQNLKVSAVGVGVMGYIGNKGSISVSMSIYQTLFCFICTHLTSGERDVDQLKRNADVYEIHRRTLFRSMTDDGLTKGIYDHERIIWFGDLNYRINLPYEQTRDLISNKEWPKLIEKDQLARELRKGRAFDGWSEGTLNFPPTYKYEMNSDKYYGEDPKIGRRNPAWCDRILSYGKGMRLLNYRRSELKLSDHRPVTATYMAEVEVFCPKKLQRALTFTDAEVENKEVMPMGIEVGIEQPLLQQGISHWEFPGTITYKPT